MITDIIKDYINGLAILHHFDTKLKESLVAPPEGPSPEVRQERREARRKPLRRALGGS